MVRAACPGTAGSHGDAGGSSVVRTRASCWPRSSKTCACRVKRAAGLQASLCRPTGCALPAPRPRDTHIARALQGRSHVPTLYCQEELSRLPSGLPVTRWCLCAGWASAGPWCLKTERKVLGLFQLLHQRKTQKEGGEEYGKGQKSPGCCVIPRSRLAGRKNIYLFLIPPVKKKKSAGEGILRGNGPDQPPAPVKSSLPSICSGSGAARSGDGRPRRGTAAAARGRRPPRSARSGRPLPAPPQTSPRGAAEARSGPAGGRAGGRAARRAPHTLCGSLPLPGRAAMRRMRACRFLPPPLRGAVRYSRCGGGSRPGRAAGMARGSPAPRPLGVRGESASSPLTARRPRSAPRSRPPPSRRQREARPGPAPPAPGALPVPLTGRPLPLRSPPRPAPAHPGVGIGCSAPVRCRGNARDPRRAAVPGGCAAPHRPLDPTQPNSVTLSPSQPLVAPHSLSQSHRAPHSPYNRT